MNLKNCVTYCELRGENTSESDMLLKASMRSYSPRAAGITPSNDRMIVLTKPEAQEFASGVLRDVDFSHVDKWAVAKLLACWCSGEITDEGATWQTRETAAK